MDKRGQEEMIGFAMIVIIVAIIGVVLLAFAIKNDRGQSGASNYEVSQFLGSSMQATSECALRNSENYVRVNELIRACYQNPENSCLNSGGNICDEAENTLSDIINSGFKVGENRTNSGFIMNVSFEGSAGSISKEVIFIQNGECKKDYTAGEFLIPEDKSKGIILARLVLCA